MRLRSVGVETDEEVARAVAGEGQGGSAETGADVAVIVTVAMPKEVSTLGCKDGVWVANHHCFIGAASCCATA